MSLVALALLLVGCAVTDPTPIVADCDTGPAMHPAPGHIEPWIRLDECGESATIEVQMPPGARAEVTGIGIHPSESAIATNFGTTHGLIDGSRFSIHRLTHAEFEATLLLEFASQRPMVVVVTGEACDS